MKIPSNTKFGMCNVEAKITLSLPLFLVTVPMWFPFILVLASGVLDHSACYDPGGVLCPDSSQLPDTAVAEAPFYHLLFCFGIWSNPYSSLGLAQWRNWCSYCTGKLSVVSIFPIFLSFQFYSFWIK